MITIASIVMNGVNVPESEIPKNAIMVVFDLGAGSFVVYEQGDELPPEPGNDSE